MDDPGRLSVRMSAVARELQSRQADAEATYQHVVDVARHSIAGCESAALAFVRSDGSMDTVASAGDLAATGDRLQQELHEGPCLDAIWEQRTVRSPDLEAEERWPTWGPRAVEMTGARSMLALRLFTHGSTLGALTLYSSASDAFDDDALEEGLAIASHAAIAIASVQEIAGLRRGLDSRTVIGQATGIVMERFRVDAATAFQVLTRLSSAEETKLRNIAEQVVAGRSVGLTR